MTAADLYKKYKNVYQHSDEVCVRCYTMQKQRIVKRIVVNRVRHVRNHVA
jgi:hypothetical protein